jgi:hypothetical protein
MPLEKIPARQIARLIVSKISESIGADLGYPNTTEVTMPSPTIIQLRIRTEDGLHYFSLRVIEHV